MFSPHTACGPDGTRRNRHNYLVSVGLPGHARSRSTSWWVQSGVTWRRTTSSLTPQQHRFRQGIFFTALPIQQPQEQRYPVQTTSACWVFSCFHRTPTLSTGSLTCVRDHSYARVYTRGLGSRITIESAHHFWLGGEKLSDNKCSYAPDGVRTSRLWIWCPTLYQLDWATPPHCKTQLFELTEEMHGHKLCNWNVNRRSGDWFCEDFSTKLTIALYTLNILQSVSEFGGIRKHEKTQHAGFTDRRINVHVHNTFNRWVASLVYSDLHTK